MKRLLVLAVTASTAAAQPHHTPPPIPPPLVPPEQRIFFGLSAGTGTGVIGGRTETLDADVATGFQWAPLQLKAELVALRTPCLGFGFSARLGFPVGADTDPPAAKSLLVKAYWLHPAGFRFSGGIGAGYVRYRVGVDGTTMDSMAAGPLLLGAGAGYVHPISKSWRVTIDVNALVGVAVTDRYAGVPNEHAAHVDLDIGLAVFR